MKRRPGHHVTIEAQKWAAVPPGPPVTLYRAICTCGECGQWYFYPENVERACPAPLALPGVP